LSPRRRNGGKGKTTATPTTTTKELVFCARKKHDQVVLAGS